MNVHQWIVLLVSLARAAAQADSSESSTMDYAAAARLKYAEKFTYAFNPEVGYQPYWVDGDVIIHDETAEPYGHFENIEYSNIAVVQHIQHSKTTPPPMVCGEECIENYRSVKHVCTHDTSNNKMSGCWRHPLGPNSENKHCWNVVPDEFVNPFHEFDTYCAYLEATCREHFTSPRYILLHIGKCKTEKFWFKDLSSYQDVLNRMTKYPLLDLATIPYRRRPTADLSAQIITKPK